MVKPRAVRKQTVVLSSDDDEATPATIARRPAKSRSLRSQVIEDQEEQDEDVSAVPTRLRSTRQTAKTTSTKPTSSSPQSSLKSPANSPKRQKTRQNLQPVHKDKSLYSFFSKTSQRKLSTPPPPASAGSTPRNDEFEDDDLIEDDDLDVVPTQATNASTASTILPVRKRSRDVGEVETQARGSQKFRKIERGKAGHDGATVAKKTADTRPWVDRFGPKDLNELAVHKKKISDVRSWFIDMFGSKSRKRLLVLKGPAGSAKTAALSLLAKDLNIELQEWRNPTSAYQSAEGFVSMAAQFEDFMARSGTFHGLEIADSSGVLQPEKLPVQLVSSQQAIVIEEFPGSLSGASSALQSFRSVILQYLTRSTPSTATMIGASTAGSRDATPVILVISETLLTSSSSSSDSFTAHRLLGHEILTHVGTSVIEFNPIAPTIMAKALDLIVTKEARISGRRNAPGPLVIKRLSEMGDVRSATSSLEFLCLRGDEQEGWGDRVRLGKAKKSSKEKPLTTMEAESLQLITQRESTLGIFHSVGKVVYNKRLDAILDTSLPQPPNHLPQHRRTRPSEVDTNLFLDELGTDIQTFISALHENYALSCRGSTDEDTMDSLNGCLDALSDADLLSPDRFSIGSVARRTFQGTATDNLRQEETSFHVAVRGILFNLPFPVKRLSPSSGSGRAGNKSEAFQMYYPTSLRLWRQKEEIEGLLDMLIHKAQSGTLDIGPQSHLSTRKDATKHDSGGVDTWRRNDPGRQSGGGGTEEGNGTMLLAGGSSARQEMLLERLPYMAKMQRLQRRTTAQHRATDIEKLTAFSGIGGPSNEEADDDEALDAAETISKIAKPAEDEGVGEDEVSKLMLSDDDIVDDD